MNRTIKAPSHLSQFRAAVARRTKSSSDTKPSSSGVQSIDGSLSHSYGQGALKGGEGAETPLEGDFVFFYSTLQESVARRGLNLF